MKSMILFNLTTAFDVIHLPVYIISFITSSDVIQCLLATFSYHPIDPFVTPSIQVLLSPPLFLDCVGTHSITFLGSL